MGFLVQACKSLLHAAVLWPLATSESIKTTLLHLTLWVSVWRVVTVINIVTTHTPAPNTANPF
jgi:hypothetical protein